MNFKLTGRPTGHRIVVLPDEAEALYKGVIIIPEEAKQVPVKGRVIQVGFEVTTCKPGDEILYGQYAGNFVDFSLEGDDVDSRKFLLLLESDITYVWECELEAPEVIDEELIKRVKDGIKETAKPKKRKKKTGEQY